MNRVVSSQPGDEFDALLTAFFRKEMPANWPAFQPPTSRAEAPPRTGPPARRASEPERGPSSGTGRSWLRQRPLLSSRLALAASIALLVCGALFAPGSLPKTGTLGNDGPIPIDPGNGGASRPHLPAPAPSSPKSDTEGAKFDSSWGLSTGPDGSVGIEVKVGEIGPTGGPSATGQKK